MIPLLICLLLGAGAEPLTEPWTSAEVMSPAKLAAAIREGHAPPVVFVGFPVLYRGAHIKGALLAGPGLKDEGIAALKEAARNLPRDREVVIYCGCCPMDHCPNIRPAYRMLREMGFRKIRVLEMPTNMHTDWVSKGYPTDHAD